MIDIVKHLKNSQLMKMARQVKYEKDLNKHKRTKEKYGYKVIRMMDKLGSELNIDIWIEWGTLLGYIREGSLISHDYDIDFATRRMSDKEYQVFIEKLAEYRFRLIRQFRYKDSIVSETYDYNGTLVDMDYCDLNEKGIKYFEYDIGAETKIEKTSGRYYYEYMDMMIYRTDSFKIIRGCFKNGVGCNIPESAEKHIEQLYGKNWRIPIPDFDWKGLNNYEVFLADPDLNGWRNA